MLGGGYGVSMTANPSGQQAWSYVSNTPGGLVIDHAAVLARLEADHAIRRGLNSERAFRADMPSEDIHHGNLIANRVSEFLQSEPFASWHCAVLDERCTSIRDLHAHMRNVLGTHDFVRKEIQWYDDADEEDYGGYGPDEKYVRDTPKGSVPFWRHSKNHPIALNRRERAYVKDPVAHALEFVVTLAHENMHAWQHMRLFGLGLHEGNLDGIDAYVAKVTKSSDYLAHKIAELANSFPESKYAIPAAGIDEYLFQASEMQAEAFAQFVMKKGLFKLRTDERLTAGDYSYHLDDPVNAARPDDVW